MKLARRHPAMMLVTLAAAAWLTTRGMPALANARVWAALGATGLLSGYLSGLLGIGGALVVVPALALLLPLLGFTPEQVPHVAVATSLVTMVPTSAVAARAHWRRGGLDGRWLRRLAPGMAIGAAAGALVALSLRGPALVLVFAVQSLYYGWGLLQPAPSATTLRGRLADACGRLPSVAVAPAIAAVCACAGMGGGSLLVPWLLHQGAPLLRSVATAGALNLCIAVGGGLAFALARNPHAQDAGAVCWSAAAWLGAGAICAVRHGVATAHVLPVAMFRRLLGGVTLAGAVMLIGRTLIG